MGYLMQPISPDSNTKQLDVREVSTGKSLFGFDEWINDFDLNPDGTQVIIVSSYGVRISTVAGRPLVAGGQLLVRLGDYFNVGPEQISFSASGKSILTSSSQGSYLVDVATGQARALGATSEEKFYALAIRDRKSTRLNSSHRIASRMPSSA